MKPTIIAVAGLLAACAAPVDPPGFPTSGTPPSINQVNVSDITNDMTVQVLAKFGTKEGSVTIAGDNPLVDEEFSAALQRAGYRLAPKNGRHTVLYATSPLGPALLVTLRIDGQRSAKLYKSGPAGEIIPASPVSVIEG